MQNPAEWITRWIANGSKKQKLVAAGLILGLLCVLGLVGTVDSSSSGDPMGSPGLYFLSAFVKLIGILILIVACSVIFRRWLGQGARGKATRQLRLVETIRLSPRQALHLVTVGDQQLLIGATDQNVSLITQLEGGLMPMMTEPAAQPVGLDFGALFQALSSSQPAGHANEKA